MENQPQPHNSKLEEFSLIIRTPPLKKRGRPGGAKNLTKKERLERKELNRIKKNISCRNSRMRKKVESEIIVNENKKLEVEKEVLVNENKNLKREYEDLKQYLEAYKQKIESLENNLKISNQTCIWVSRERDLFKAENDRLIAEMKFNKSMYDVTIDASSIFQIKQYNPQSNS